MFLCIPIVYGCPAKLENEGQNDQIVCPRCHNATCFRYKQKKRFELCYIPLIPLKSKEVYYCSTCQWKRNAAEVNINDGNNGKVAPNASPAGEGGGQRGGYNVGYASDAR